MTTSHDDTARTNLGVLTPPSAPDPLDPAQMVSLRHWGTGRRQPGHTPCGNETVIDCGWGRLIFGQTFADPQRLVDELLRETLGGARPGALPARPTDRRACAGAAAVVHRPVLHLPARSGESANHCRHRGAGDSASACRRWRRDDPYLSLGGMVPPLPAFFECEPTPHTDLLVAERNDGTARHGTGVDHRSASSTIGQRQQPVGAGGRHPVRPYRASAMRSCGRWPTVTRSTAARSSISVLHDNSARPSRSFNLWASSASRSGVRKNKNPDQRAPHRPLTPAANSADHARILSRKPAGGIGVDVIDACTAISGLKLAAAASSAAKSLSESRPRLSLCRAVATISRPGAFSAKRFCACRNRSRPAA